MVISESWDNILKEEYKQDYFIKLMQLVEEEYKNHTVYPLRQNLFAALKAVPYENVRVVILGQDPYHGEGQANGMCFAVGNGISFPPSLVNIFKELKDDLGEECKDGTLLTWAKQGVLLLNTVLTVRAGEPLSHAGLGWQTFTDSIISSFNAHSPVAFILWGANAIAKRNLIRSNHFIIASPHPSPLSAYRGFFGSKPFSKINSFLVQSGLPSINWSGHTLPDYYKNISLIKRI